MMLSRHIGGFVEEGDYISGLFYFGWVNFLGGEVIFHEGNCWGVTFRQGKFPRECVVGNVCGVFNVEFSGGRGYFPRGKWAVKILGKIVQVGCLDRRARLVVSMSSSG